MSAGLKEHGVTDLGVGTDPGAQRVGHGEGDQEIGHRQQQALSPLLQPLIGVRRPAEGAMPIVAGMIAVVEPAAVQAAKQFSAQLRSAAAEDGLEHLPLPLRHGGAELLQVLRPEPGQKFMKAEPLGPTAAGQLSRHGQGSLEVAHKLIQALLVLSFAEAGQMGVEGGDGRALVAEVDLDLAQILSLLKEVGRVGMAQRVHVGGLLEAAGLESQTKSPLQSGAAHRRGGGGGAVASSSAFGRKQEHGMAMGFPLLAQQFQGALGQRHVTVTIAFAAADVEEHALGVNVAHLETETFTQTQAAGVDGRQANAVIEFLDFGQEAADFGGGEDHGQLELRIGADQFQFVGPRALEGFLPEELESADELRGGLASDFLDGLEMDAVLPDLFKADQFGRAAVMLAELADAGVIGLLGARADREEL